MKSLQLSGDQLDTIFNAATWLFPPDRDDFWGLVATELQDHEIGDGTVACSVANAFRVDCQPPPEADGLHAPKLLKKIGDRRVV